MQPEMTAHEIANEIGLRQIQSRIYGEGETFVMVEGKTDEVLWEEFRSNDDCTLYPAYGKEKIMEVLSVITKRKMRGIAGIVDADYWLITEAQELATENLLYDDCCPDMELILLESPALKKALRHTFDDIEINDIHAFADALRSQSLRIAREFGYFRLVNHIFDYGLHCNAIQLKQVIDLDTLDLDRNLVASRLAAKSVGLTRDDLLSQTDELREEYPPCSIKLCRGKDVLDIMATILPRMYENCFERALPKSANGLARAGQLAKELRKAYEYIYFRETSLFARIRDWECENPKYQLLKPQI